MAMSNKLNGLCQRCLTKQSRMSSTVSICCGVRITTHHWIRLHDGSSEKTFSSRYTPQRYLVSFAPFLELLKAYLESFALQRFVLQ